MGEKFKVTRMVELTPRGSITGTVWPPLPCGLTGCVGELHLFGPHDDLLGRLHLDETNRRELIEALGGVVPGVAAPSSATAPYYCRNCGALLDKLLHPDGTRSYEHALSMRVECAPVHNGHYGVPAPDPTGALADMCSQLPGCRPGTDGEHSASCEVSLYRAAQDSGCATPECGIPEHQPGAQNPDYGAGSVRCPVPRCTATSSDIGSHMADYHLGPDVEDPCTEPPGCDLYHVCEAHAGGPA